MNLKEWAVANGVHPHTAYRWFREGTLPVPAKRMGPRTILVNVDAHTSPSATGGVGLYARVSSHDQKDDLERHARVYLPVRDSPALDGTGARWELPAGRFAVALHVGPHSEVDRTYAALGTYAAAHGRDGAGPVRERYLAHPLDTPDITQWRTEVCWPMAPAGVQAN
jgi:effector-binding domain-containing protein